MEKANWRTTFEDKLRESPGVVLCSHACIVLVVAAGCRGAVSAGTVTLIALFEVGFCEKGVLCAGVIQRDVWIENWKSIPCLASFWDFHDLLE